MRRASVFARVGLPGPQILAFVKFYLQNILYIISKLRSHADYILYTILYTIDIANFNCMQILLARKFPALSNFRQLRMSCISCAGGCVCQILKKLRSCKGFVKFYSQLRLEPMSCAVSNFKISCENLRISEIYSIIYM